MTKKESLQLFQDKNVRVVWDDKEEKYYFSVVDVIGVLTDSPEPRKYWSVLKGRIRKEANESTTICSQLKLTSSDGKAYKTDVADQEQLFRIIQSVPSPKAEPFKQWMALVASQRIDQMQDPELSIEQAIADYRRLGYSEEWITQRIKTIETRKDLTDEWQRRGVEGQQFAALTDIITKTWSGFTTKQYKQHKGLRKENLRDNMTNAELALNMLAEASATEISKSQAPQTYADNKRVAFEGGKVAQVAREQLEKSIGHSVVSDKKASDYLPPTDKKKLKPKE